MGDLERTFCCSFCYINVVHSVACFYINVVHCDVCSVILMFYIVLYIPLYKCGTFCCMLCVINVVHSVVFCVL